jgi:alginate O-acetyltransferase complex protein AlgI
MLFNSYAFIALFMPVVLLISWRLRGPWLLRWITVASLGFYGFAGHAWFIIPMLVTTCLDFFIAPILQRSKQRWKRRLLLSISLCGNLGLLAFFKYSGLLMRTVGDLAQALHASVPPWMSLFDVILPAGISFYTFQTLSYMIDVYRGHCEAETSFFRFASFVSFFPHLVAGPLTRHDQLIPQLQRVADEGIRPRWTEGVLLFAVGLCKKTLIADRIAHPVDALLLSPGHLTLVSGWLAAVGYAIQIYFDFSGYSDMAIGLARLFGIDLPQNFNSPYTATDPQDFWHRWHMTLSAWLRDYLYIPLGGNRCSEARSSLNLLATMVLGGLWHGASWTFAAWGFFHGILLVLFRSTKSGWRKMPVWFQRILMFALVCVGWVFFRAKTFADAGNWLSSMAGAHGIGLQGITGLASLALLAVLGLAIANVFPNASSSKRLGSLRPSYQGLLGVATFAALALMNSASPFLYFQF